MITKILEPQPPKVYHKNRHIHTMIYLMKIKQQQLPTCIQIPLFT